MNEPSMIYAKPRNALRAIAILQIPRICRGKNVETLPYSWTNDIGSVLTLDPLTKVWWTTVVNTLVPPFAERCCLCEGI